MGWKCLFWKEYHWIPFEKFTSVFSYAWKGKKTGNKGVKIKYCYCLRWCFLFLLLNIRATCTVLYEITIVLILNYEDIKIIIFIIPFTVSPNIFS